MQGGPPRLYYNSSADSIQVGLRLQSGCQRLLQLSSGSCLLTRKQRRGLTVSYIARQGDKKDLWAFALEVEDESKSSSSAEASEEEEEQEEEDEDEEEEPEIRTRYQRPVRYPGKGWNVVMKDLPVLQRYHGRCGVMDSQRAHPTKGWIDFPTGAPSKFFPRHHFDSLPPGSPMIDRFSPDTELWLYRGPGLHASVMRWLRSQKKKRALVTMIGYQKRSDKFLLKLDGDRQDCFFELPFSQTGVLQPLDADAGSSSDSDPKAKDSSSEAEK